LERLRKTGEPSGTSQRFPEKRVRSPRGTISGGSSLWKMERGLKKTCGKPLRKGVNFVG